MLARWSLLLVVVPCAACRDPAPQRAATVTPAPAPTPTASIDATPMRRAIALPDFMAEGLAWDAPRERLLLGGIVAQSIAAVARDGSVTRFAATPQGWSVFGVGIDATRGWVWAACSAVPQGRALPATVGAAGLFAFSLDDGALVHARTTASDDDDPHLFGDLAIAPDGRVFTTDSIGGGLYAASAGEAALRELAPPRSFRSAQGLVVLDGEALLVADYSRGLVRVALGSADTDATLQPMPTPADADLRGIDGMARRGRDVVAVLNGAEMPQVLQLRLTEGHDAVESVQILLEPSPDDGEPTLVTIVGDEAWVTQTDRWNRVFGPDARPRADVTIAAPVVVRARLQ